MQDQQLVGVLPRHLRQVRVERVEEWPDAVHIHATVDTDEAACPACQVVSRSVRERYQRRLADTPLAATPVWILLQVRRFNCLNAACSKRTFAEQVPELTVPRGRRSSPLRAMLRHISVALAGRAGARLAAKFAIPASRSTLLRLLRATPPTSPSSAPRVLGVDDFALRRGQVYATVLVDMDTHQPVDVLPDRTAETLAAWLREHPGAQVVCRDRAGAYADGVRIGAPDAIQVADRFHLWMNLGEAVLNTVIAQRRHLTVPDPPPAAPVAAATPEPDTEIRLVTRTKERYAAVQQLLADGCSRAEVARRLGLDIQTVRRFANAACIEDLLAGTRRDSVLDPFKPYLQQRYHDGHTDTATLLEEIRQRGYRGSIQTLRRYLRPSRPEKPPKPPAPPKPRQVTKWIMMDPAKINPDDHAHLAAICSRSTILAAVREHVSRFARMICTLGGTDLPQWITDVQADDLPSLHTFIQGAATRPGRRHRRTHPALQFRRCRRRR